MFGSLDKASNCLSNYWRPIAHDNALQLRIFGFRWSVFLLQNCFGAVLALSWPLFGRCPVGTILTDTLDPNNMRLGSLQVEGCHSVFTIQILDSKVDFN